MVTLHLVMAEKTQSTAAQAVGCETIAPSRELFVFLKSNDRKDKWGVKGLYQAFWKWVITGKINSQSGLPRRF
jgi:hypothetical protein